MAASIENEMMYINAWVKQSFPGSKVFPRMRLGAMPDGDPYKDSLRVWPDKIIITETHVILVEGKIKPSTRAIGQLEAYKDQFPLTAEFQPYKEMPIRLILLTPVDNRFIREMAEKKGIEYVVFRPVEVEELLVKRFRLED